jgi:hypothetical protein
VPGATPPACPPTERLASIASCTALGQQCLYPSACASIPDFDTCLCTGDDGPHFECKASCEVGDAAAPDAHVTDATAPDDGRAPGRRGRRSVAGRRESARVAPRRGERAVRISRPRRRGARTR